MGSDRNQPRPKTCIAAKSLNRAIGGHEGSLGELIDRAYRDAGAKRTVLFADAMMVNRSVTASTIAQYHIDDQGVRLELEIGAASPGLKTSPCPSARFFA